MSLPKLLAYFSIAIFGLIGLAAYFKKGDSSSGQQATSYKDGPIEIELNPQVAIAKVAEKPPLQTKQAHANSNTEVKGAAPKLPFVKIQEVDRIEEFFGKGEPKFPIVETLKYKSRVPWLKGRSAWLSDYASHYATSRHFIARSLNDKPDYFKQTLVEGDLFNVFKLDKNIAFHLVVDMRQLKLLFYYIDLDAQEHVLVKTYTVGLGRPDAAKASGHLTPLGKYSLGQKIGIYQPKTLGLYNGEKTELIKIFGTRWIPFENEIEGCTEPAKGLGIHGVPWMDNGKGVFVEDKTSVGTYSSDGCIRLATADIEEIFAIVITKPTTIEIVKDFQSAKLPGIVKK